MKNAIIFCLTLSLFACRPTGDAHSHGHADEHADEHGHGEGATAFTHFTDKTELFVEVQPLIVGHASEAAAHVTRLSDYRALTSGHMEVELIGADGSAKFSVDGPSSPGIFRPSLKPNRAGKVRLIFRVKDKGIDVTHEAGQMQVYANAEAAHAAAEHAEDDESAGAISFLKEQQWRMDFALGVVATRRIRPAFEAFGHVRPRADGEAWISAPLAGRLAAGKGFPRVGTTVKRGQTLAVMSPRLAEQGDSATLEAAVQRAATNVRQTERDRRRLESLAAAGAVPENQLVAARFAEEQARIAQETARRRLRQTRRGEESDDGPTEGGLPIRSPIAGTIVAVDRPPGAWVDEGERLFRVIDMRRLWLEVHVIETHLRELKTPHGIWFELEGFPQILHAGRDALISVGEVVDSRTRTVSVLFEIANPERQLRVGMFAQVHVITEKPRMTLTAPVAAILIESGQPVAYVQAGGEAFVRRQLRIGERDGDRVEVLEGLKEGERVVTKGAYTVRLAGSSGDLSSGHHH